MAAIVVEVHHNVPRCLLGFFDRAASGKLDRADFEAWFEWEEEAFRCGVDPETTRGELTAPIESSTVELSADEHRAAHSGGW